MSEVMERGESGRTVRAHLCSSRSAGAAWATKQCAGIIDLWKKEAPNPPQYMKELNARKEAIRKTFEARDSIGDTMLTRAIGKELAHLSLITQF